MLAQFRSFFASGVAQFRTTYLGAGSIVVHDNFDGNNIDAANSVITTDVDSVTLVRLKVYPSRTTTTTDRWLNAYGKVSGLLGQQPRFEFFDGAQSESTWRTDSRPLFSTNGGQTWTPFADGDSANRTFRHNAQFAADEILVCEWWREPVTEYGDRIAAWAAAHSTKVFPTTTALAFTPSATAGWPAQDFIAAEFPAATDLSSGRAVPATPLYGFTIDDQAFWPKPKTFVITGGVHAGEDCGQLPMRLFLDLVLGDSEAAAQLRQRYRFVVYPMINAPGRWAGHFRGVPDTLEDPNRHWLAANPTNEVARKAKHAILADTGGSAEIAWDFHSTPGYSSVSRWSKTVSTTQFPPTRALWDLWTPLLSAQGLGLQAYLGMDSSIDTATSLTIRGFFARELGARSPDTFEVNQSGPPMSEAMFAPFASTLLQATAQLAAQFADGITGTLLVTEASDTFVAQGVGITTGALSATEAADTFSASGASTVAGALAATEQADTFAAAGSQITAGALLATEPSDGFAATGIAITHGALSATESADTFAGAGTTRATGALIASDAPDTFAASGIAISRGALAATETGDQFIASVASFMSGMLEAAESADTADMLGSIIERGSMAATESPDTFEARRFTVGAMSAFEDADSFAAAGVERLLGQMDALEAADEFEAAGDVRDTTVLGDLLATEARDTFSGSVASFVSGSFAATEIPDAFAAEGAIRADASLLTTEQRDSFAAAGTIVESGAMDATEPQDSAAMSGIEVLRGAMGATEAPDTFEAAGSVRDTTVVGDLFATEPQDAFTGTTVPILLPPAARILRARGESRILRAQ